MNKILNSFTPVRESQIIDQSPDVKSILQQILDVNTLLQTIMGDLSSLRNPQVSLAIQDLIQATKTLKQLSQRIGTQIDTEQRQLEKLIGVGQVINSSLGLTQVLEEVMDSLIKLMHAERGFLMGREPNGRLRIYTVRGVDSKNPVEDVFSFSKTIVRQAVETGEAVLTSNAGQDPRFENQMSVTVYQLRSILCAPLKIKEEIIGVVYVDNRAHTGTFQESDKKLISAFADQAAVAIDNARLFDNLAKSNQNLAVALMNMENAYEATLKGWVHALDLRDKETEGHTQRVTTLTRRLAKAMGVKGEELLNITRGALLHDIGKMAIPDSILLKPADLTPEERELIEQHPIFAYQMLCQIEFLRPALDIPYYHHEKWDGTGYPHGLKGKDIPFAARIFPVVDVWDALTSDRPYRKKLQPEEVRKHIRELSGSHFDPRIVEAFLNLGDYSTTETEVP